MDKLRFSEPLYAPLVFDAYGRVVENDPDEPIVESVFAVTSRLCEERGVDRVTDEIFAEADAIIVAQEAVRAAYLREKRRREADAAYLARMGGVATALVEALLAPDDSRDRAEVTAAVLDALRPIDDRIENHDHPDQLIR